MSSGKDNFLNLLKVLTVSFAGLSEEQYKNLLAGRARLVYQELSSGTGTVKRKKSLQDTDINECIDRIALFSSREEAKAYLKEAKHPKAVLEEIAGQLKVHVLKNDTKDKMIDKIVEAVVGARLRSEAIRDTDLKGGPVLKFKRG